MSFQGDVAGLGLTEVLQSIARGDKDGVLELDAGDLQARLGMRSGMVFPLPASNEKHDVWRERSERAWAELPSPELEGARRERIVLPLVSNTSFMKHNSTYPIARHGPMGPIGHTWEHWAHIYINFPYYYRLMALWAVLVEYLSFLLRHPASSSCLRPPWCLRRDFACSRAGPSGIALGR